MAAAMIVDLEATTTNVVNKKLDGLREEALAWLRGTDYVTPAFVQEVFPDVLRHRVGLTYEAESSGLTADRMRARAARRNNSASRYFPRNVGEGDLLETFDLTQRPSFYKAAGCSHCTNTGFTGRRGIYELLLIDDALDDEGEGESHAQ